MFFESQIRVNQVRKQMLVLECDTQRLLLEERWQHLRGQVGLGKSQHVKESGRWHQFATLAAPVGAFFLSRWFRRRKSPPGARETSSTNDYLSLLGSVFDWMARFNRS